jgi:hypothetical protein
MAGALDLRAEAYLEGATHYTMLLLDEHARQVAGTMAEFIRRKG